MVAIGSHVQCDPCGAVLFMNRAVHGEPRYCPSCGKKRVRIVADQAVRFTDSIEHPAILAYQASTQRSFLEQLKNETREPAKPRCSMLGWDAVFWRRAVAAAVLDAPYGPSMPCPVCGEIHRLTRNESLWLDRRRTKYLEACRRDPHGPSREDVAQVCRWIMRWGYRPANYWLHYAGLPVPRDGAFRSPLDDVEHP